MFKKLREFKTRFISHFKSGKILDRIYGTTFVQTRDIHSVGADGEVATKVYDAVVYLVTGSRYGRQSFVLSNKRQLEMLLNSLMLSGNSHHVPYTGGSFAVNRHQKDMLIGQLKPLLKEAWYI